MTCHNKATPASNHAPLAQPTRPACKHGIPIPYRPPGPVSRFAWCLDPSAALPHYPHRALIPAPPWSSVRPRGDPIWAVTHSFSHPPSFLLRLGLLPGGIGGLTFASRFTSLIVCSKCWSTASGNWACDCRNASYSAPALASACSWENAGRVDIQHLPPEDPLGRANVAYSGQLEGGHCTLSPIHRPFSWVFFGRHGSRNVDFSPCRLAIRDRPRGRVVNPPRRAALPPAPSSSWQQNPAKIILRRFLEILNPLPIHHFPTKPPPLVASFCAK